MLKVLTWYWIQPGGRTQYTAEHVNLWADMVRRHLSLPHRLACVTAHPEGIDSRVEIIKPPGEFESVRIPSWGPQMPQCLRRIAMFRPDAAGIFGERFVNMDVDCVVGASLDPLFDRSEDFIIYRGTAHHRPYNGSMMMMTAGARPQVYTELTPARAIEAGRRFVGSDQAWISEALGPGEATWDRDDGVYFWSKGRRGPGQIVPMPENGRVLFFPGWPKPWEIAGNGLNAWVDEHYRMSGNRRTLILGYAETVWAEAELALAGGPFDVVVASPEAAEHWPGKVDAVARTDGQAERMARMLGAGEIVFCGRQPDVVEAA